MANRKKEPASSRQEQAVKQQEILEKKRRARAEYNVSKGPESLSDRKYDLERRFQENKEEREIVRAEKKEAKNERKKEKRQRKFQKDFHTAVAFDSVEGVSISQWFLSICWIQIPVIGFIYALVLILNPKTHASKRNFAVGYLIYRILVLILAGTILYVLYRVGLNFVDELLSFVQ